MSVQLSCSFSWYACNIVYCYISYILDQLEYLDGTGVHIADKTLFLYTRRTYSVIKLGGVWFED